MKLTRRSRLKPHIDMTPLIDCIFTLLIVIMLVASFQSFHQIQMTLPQAQTQDTADTPEIVVNVDARGNYFLDAERIEPTQLENVLRSRVARSKSRNGPCRGD